MHDPIYGANHPQAISADDMTLFEILKYTIECSNKFFRIIRAHGIWIPDPHRSHAVAAGRDMNASRPTDVHGSRMGTCRYDNI